MSDSDESFGEFDERLWNEEREYYEQEVRIAVGNLSDFMGCNSFTLPFTNLTVKVSPSSA